MIQTVLLVEDEASIREAYALRLEHKGYVVHTARNGEEGIALLQKTPPDILILDMVMSGISGLELLKEIRTADPELPVIVLTARGTIRDAVEAMRLGAFDFVTKSIDMDELFIALANASRFLTLSQEARYRTGQESERFSLDRMIAEGEVSRTLKKQIKNLASNDQITVLLQGETGSGKEYASKLIHYNGSRSERPFIEVDCPAIPSELFESELFGYEKGSFTGATTRKVGLLELSDGGTVLLDEIGDLPLHLQAKLLRVIEDRKIRRVGGGAQYPINVRFMAATHRDLRQAVKNGQFREDLFYRLNVVSLHIPALRERREDIIPMAERFLYESAQAFRKNVRTIAPDAQEMLLSYDFPGNIRELSNLMERAVMFCAGPRLEAKNFPSDMNQIRQETFSPGTSRTNDVGSELVLPMYYEIGKDSLPEHEKNLIKRVLEKSGGNKTLAASRLGISRWALDRRIKGS
ncbi:MAG: sigma-54-dependent transcriptional regulator [Leptospirillum sp.]